MNELGAVNLAALDELASGRERKGFLDSQSADLEEAVTTMEDAIRRIDRETRELLRETFDEREPALRLAVPGAVRRRRAKLVMTGEEILDAGVQVMAHPPGKRNTSIHLLSGGEKALTAISLVFALFQLNPAPFCLLDEVDAPLDDSNTTRFCDLVRKMSAADAVPVHQPQQDHHGNGQPADRRNHAGVGRVARGRGRHRGSPQDPGGARRLMSELQIGLLAIGGLVVAACSLQPHPGTRRRNSAAETRPSVRSTPMRCSMRCAGTEARERGDWTHPRIVRLPPNRAPARSRSRLHRRIQLHAARGERRGARAVGRDRAPPRAARAASPTRPTARLARRAAAGLARRRHRRSRSHRVPLGGRDAGRVHRRDGVGAGDARSGRGGARAG
jgi:hypothetical protein